MITAEAYRKLLMPAPMSDRDLNLHISKVLHSGPGGPTELEVRVQRVDVERASRLITAYQFEVVKIDEAPYEELAAAFELAKRIGGYNPNEFVWDTIHFGVPKHVVIEANTRAGTTNLALPKRPVAPTSDAG